MNGAVTKLHIIAKMDKIPILNETYDKFTKLCKPYLSKEIGRKLIHKLYHIGFPAIKPNSAPMIILPS